MNQMYGFNGEVKSKYTAQMAELFTEVYNWLPLAHCLNKRVLVMHGGLFSRDDVTLDEIRKIDRYAIIYILLPSIKAVLRNKKQIS